MTLKSFSESDGPDDSAMLRYMSGESPLPEAESIRAWLADDPRRQASVDELQSAWATAPSDATSAPSWDRAQVWSAIAAELHAGRDDATSHRAIAVDAPTRPARRYSRVSSSANAVRRWTLGAAALVAVVGAGVVVGRREHPTVRPAHTYTTGSRERLDVMLPDGSHVILAPRTTLTVAQGYGTTTRDVALSGQAQFTVSASTRAPFVVRDGVLAIRVLGTHFDVQHYPGDPATQVVVVSGKVAVGDRALSRTLTAGMAGWFTDSTARTQIVDTDGYTDWTRGQLVFRNVPLAAMLRTLGRWYGLEFRMTDSALARQPMTAAFQMDEPNETIRLLSRLLRVSIAVQDTIVTLSPARSAQMPKTKQHSDVTPVTSEVGR